MKTKNNLIFVLILLFISTFCYSQTVKEIKVFKKSFLFKKINNEFVTCEKIKKDEKVTLFIDSTTFIYYPFVKIKYKETVFYIHRKSLNVYTLYDIETNYKDSIKHINDSIIYELHKADSIKKIMIEKEKHCLDSIELDRKNKIFLDSMDISFDNFYNENRSLVKRGYYIEIEKMYLYESYKNYKSLKMSFYNLSLKQIKYVHLNGYAVNAVDDKCMCAIKRSYNISLKLIGPLGFLEKGSFECEDIIYNKTAEKFVLTSINIIYMDNSVVYMNKEKIDFLLELPLFNERHKYYFDNYDKLNNFN